MAYKKKVRMEDVVSGLVPSPENLAALREEISRSKARLEVLVGLEEVMAKAVNPKADPSTSSAEPASNETLIWLVSRYKTDQRSPYQKVRYTTRRNYNSVLRRLEDVGDIALADIETSTIQQWYDGWLASVAGSGKNDGTAMAHYIITMLRGVVNFGATELENDKCKQLSFMLRKMHFSVNTRSAPPLTADQVKAIIKKANEKGLYSIALAQAIQFQCEMKQRDVIGEWTPKSENVKAVVQTDTSKWFRGLLWTDIDRNYVLKRPQGNMALTTAPLVMAALNHYEPISKRTGPLIVCETNGLPWSGEDFRKKWRELAREVGISDDVFNTYTGGRSRRPDDQTASVGDTDEKFRATEDSPSAARH